MMWTGELRLAQQDGALPTTLAAGARQAKVASQSFACGFRDVAHFSGDNPKAPDLPCVESAH